MHGSRKTSRVRYLFEHTAFLFSDLKIGAATEGRSSYGHTFGGPHDREGASQNSCNGTLIHLLHRLNLDDPSIPVSIPGIRWLPLYYVFNSADPRLGYQLHSDESLTTFFSTEKKNQSDKSDYPTEFPQTGIVVSDYGYDPANTDDVYSWAGVFRFGKLPPTKRNEIRQRLYTEELEPLGFNPPESDSDYDEWMYRPFVQGIPYNNCLNPQCENNEAPTNLPVIALMSGHPVDGIHVFGRWGDDVTIIFQQCPKCFTINVTNECT